MTDTFPDLVARLPNAEQARAITHGHGPIRITAGAGTGKTFTLTQRVVRLVGDGLCRPDEILALTFGDKAAAQMREKITEALLDIVPPDVDPPAVLTYHSFGNAVLAEWGGLIGLPPRPSLLSKADQWLLLWDCLPHIDFRRIDLLHLRGTYGSPLPSILALSSRLNDELATPGQLGALLRAADAAEVVENPDLRDKLGDFVRALEVYEAAKRDRGVIDFGDQIALAVRVLTHAEVRAVYKERFSFVLVDEYQDTNFAQSKLVQLLMQEFEQRNVCVVGDVRQAIYRFRGAAPDNILRFPADFAGASPYTLSLNYRSTEQILRAANALWAGTDDEGAALQTADGKQGPPVIACACEDRDSEWEWIAQHIRSQHDAGVPFSEMAILFRTNELKLQAWRGLCRRGIPAIMTGGTDLLRTPEVREIIAYLRALVRPSDNIALAHIASSDSFGIDETLFYQFLGPLPKSTSLLRLMLERSADHAAPAELRLFLATFQRLLGDAATMSPARVVEHIIGLRRGAYSDHQQSNVYRFHLIVETFSRERVRGATLAAFISYITLLLSAPIDETEAVDVTAEDAVQLLTVHGAKGLERDVIFMASASEQDFKMSNQADPLPATLRHPAMGMPATADYPVHKRYLAALKKWESEQHLLEERRIAYVALTRARQQLYISWHRTPLWHGKERRPLEALKDVLPLAVQERFDRSDWESDPPAQPAPEDASQLARRFIRLQASLWATWTEDEFSMASGEAAQSIRDAWERYAGEDGLSTERTQILDDGIRQWVVLRREVDGLLSRCLTPAVRPADAGKRQVIEMPATVSYSMLATYQECSRKAYLSFLAGFPGEPRPWATSAGTAFHAAVEAAARDEDANFEEMVQVYEETAAEAQGVPAYAAGETDRAMLRSFWESPDRFATPLHVEQEFYWRVGPGYLHGFIDRIQRCPDGSIELIDFKTSRAAVSAEQARENLQLRIYALATREVLGIAIDRLTLVYPRLGSRISVCFSDEELASARRKIVDLMERARTASYDEVNTAHCSRCEYRLVCPAAGVFGQE